MQERRFWRTLGLQWCIFHTFHSKYLGEYRIPPKYDSLRKLSLSLYLYGMGYSIMPSMFPDHLQFFLSSSLKKCSKITRLDHYYQLSSLRFHFDPLQNWTRWLSSHSQWSIVFHSERDTFFISTTATSVLSFCNGLEMLLLRTQQIIIKKVRQN